MDEPAAPRLWLSGFSCNSSPSLLLSLFPPPLFPPLLHGRRRRRRRRHFATEDEGGRQPHKDAFCLETLLLLPLPLLPFLPTTPSSSYPASFLFSLSSSFHLRLLFFFFWFPFPFPSFSPPALSHTLSLSPKLNEALIYSLLVTKASSSLPSVSQSHFSPSPPLTIPC